MVLLTGCMRGGQNEDIRNNYAKAIKFMGRESFNLQTPVVEKKEVLSLVNINDVDVSEKLAKLVGCSVEDIPVDEIEENIKYISGEIPNIGTGKPWNYIRTKNKVFLRVYTKDYPEDGKHKGDIVIDIEKNKQVN